MKKKHTVSRRRARAASELVRADTRPVNFARFKHDLGPEEIASLGVRAFDLGDIAGLFGTIETLSPTRTVGRGRTNLTIIEPAIVQVDATVPNASFDRTASPRRNPALQVHFEPGAYGITSPATYFMAFLVDVNGPAEFRLDGFHGPGGITNSGTRVLTGRTTVTLVFRDLAPTQQVFGFIEQVSGSTWSWFSTRLTFPPLVITL